MMHANDKIYVAGHQGLVGSAIVRRLRELNYDNLVLRSRAELDLTCREQVVDFFAQERPELVILAAAKVGGIVANDTLPADFLRENLLIETNVIDAAYRSGVRKLEFLGSSCIYPKFARQPIDEAALLSGPLEATNEAYAIAKIAGIKLCQAYFRQYGFEAISLMPCNLYGPGDNFHPEHSHVLPSLIRRFHQSKLRGDVEVTVWGTGKPLREFLYVDDLADAAVFLMQHYHDPEIVNVGTGRDLSIRELAELVQEVVGFDGRITFEASRPDGTPRKLLDVTKLTTLGWEARTSLRTGLERTYAWFLEQQHQLRGVETVEAEQVVASST